MMLRSALVGLALLATAPAFAGHRETSTITTFGPTIEAGKWQFRYSTGMPRSPSPAIGGGFEFIFPGMANEVDYLTTPVRMAAKVRARITLSVDTSSGEPVFWAHNDAGGYCQPGFVRIMLQKYKDDMRNADGRWWASVAFQIASPAMVMMEIPITDLSKWSNVYGQFASTRPDKFKSTMSNLGNVGVTFGGCNNFGHGVNTTGGVAKMTVTEFIVE